MLELRQAEGAFRALQEYLDGEGFWSREDAVADLFLAYGLSQSIRRERPPAPPEPCPLPLLACRIRTRPNSWSGDTAGFAVGEWGRSWTDTAYAAAVEEVRAAIARGDVYQVNLVQHLSAEFAGDPHALAAALAPLRPLVPDPFVTPGWAIGRRP